MSLANPVATTTSRNPFIDGILTESHWADDRPGESTRIAFNVLGDDGRTETFRRGLDGGVTALTNAAEEAAFKAALALFAEVSGLSFVEVATQGAADLLLGAGPAPGFEGALGFATTPGGDATGVKINSDNLATDDLSSLRPGGYDFITVLHEVGHALGLKHPFDDGKFPPFPGVSGPGDFGDNDLNQGVYTVMGYDDGFPRRDGPGDTSRNEGWTATPMAFDVAALQHLYGVNTTTRTGNDTYVLTDGRAREAYACIWDAGGLDTIRVGGAADAVIDLRAATLLNAPGGGGFLSAHAGVKGGFTIAKGAVIENGTGGAGDDVLIGNAAANTLSGGAGDDVLRGGGGADRLLGGTGDDRLVGGAGADQLLGGGGADTFAFTRLGDTDADAPDRIGGWDARDVIDLRALDRLIAGDLRLVAAEDVTGASGEVFVERGFGVTQVQILADDRPGIDLTIVLSGAVSLAAGDLLL